MRKKQINKVEKRKIDYTNQLHWELINSLLSKNDIVFLGDIKSHDIVKKGSNKYLNQEFNDLKFFIFKQRMKYKACLAGKKVIMVNEYLTTQGCSECGVLTKPSVDDPRIHDCIDCGAISDRDINSAKNIYMKGVMCM